MKVKWYLQFLSVFCALSISQVVLATSITPKAGQPVKFKPDHAAGQDFLYVNPPNSAGISINNFSRFDVAKPLKLANTPGYDRVTGAEKKSAETIVIIATNINLSSVIDIVGPATDILFITNDASGGKIKCVSCVFNNTLRLTLVAGHSPDLNSNSDSIHSILTKGVLDINSLYAPGAIALGLVAGQVISSGEININQGAIKSSAGGFVQMPGGSYSIGTGGIDVISGEFGWDYKAQRINSIGNSSNLYSLSGTFKAPRVNISTPQPLRFDGRIDTRVDVITAVSYKGETHIPQEGAVLQSLSDAQDAAVILNGDIYSGNTVDIRSAHNLTINSSSSITAIETTLLVGERLLNKGEVISELIFVAANEVLNEGVFDASNTADLWAEMDLSNQYGGVIRAPTIKLGSENTVVRNGSRTPYRTDSGNRNNLFLFSGSKILNHLESGRDDDPLLLNSTESGAYYILPKPFLVSDNSKSVMPADSSASIIGGRVIISSPGFENINPYYVYVENGNALMDRQKIQQVLLSAESELRFQGPTSQRPHADYFLNSSGIITVNNVRGALKIASARFVNQRYRVASVLDIRATSKSENNYSDNNHPVRETETNTAYQSKTVIYSPPAFLNIMGSAELNLSQYFVNIFGYFEVFGSAKIGSPLLKNFGLQNQELNRLKFESSPLHASGDVYTTYSTSAVRKPSDLDSLFFVAGALDASATSAWFGTLNPFTYFVNQAAATNLDEMIDMLPSPTSYNWTNYGSYTQGTYYRNLRDIRVTELGLNSIKQDGSVVVEWDYDKIEFKQWHEYPGNPDHADNYERKTKITENKEYNLFELLTNYYEAVKDKFLAILEEFNWWGAEA